MPTPDITFKAHFGNEVKTVAISEVEGTGSQCYHVDINCYYHGRLWKTSNFGWQNDLKDEWITAADIDIIIDLIEQG